MYSMISSPVILPSLTAALTGSSSSSTTGPKAPDTTTGGALGGTGALGDGGATGLNTGTAEGELEIIFFASETPFILFLLAFNIVARLAIAFFTLSLFNINSSASDPS